MTTMVVPAQRPTRSSLSEHDALSPSDAQRLYRASFVDVCETVLHGEADLLVNYPNPDWFEEDVDPQADLRSILNAELPDPDAVRYEAQVGPSRASRVGNALTHLLETEDEETVAVLEPTAPLFSREHVGTLAMKLRRHEVVLGPAQSGDLYLAGFTEPIDFEDAFANPALETMTDRGRASGLGVAYLPILPRLDSGPGLATAVSLVRSRIAADGRVPTRTAAAIEEIGLFVDEDGTVSSESGA